MIEEMLKSLQELDSAWKVYHVHTLNDVRERLFNDYIEEEYGDVSWNNEFRSYLEEFFDGNQVDYVYDRTIDKDLLLSVNFKKDRQYIKLSADMFTKEIDCYTFSALGVDFIDDVVKKYLVNKYENYIKNYYTKEVVSILKK